MSQRPNTEDLDTEKSMLIHVPRQRSSKSFELPSPDVWRN